MSDRSFYGSVFMANAASLLLPGSNLTNLLVLSRESSSGAAFAAAMLPAWLAACALTTLFLALAYRLQEGTFDDDELPPLRLGIGAAATLTAATLVLVLANAALPVVVLGLVASVLRRLRPRIDARALSLLFVLTLGLGTFARVWNGPARLLESSGAWTTAAIAAVSSVLLNNLPAATLFSAQAPPHPQALLLGLDLGPNLAVTGSLSAFLWLQAARTVNADTSIATYSWLGALLVPLTLTGSLAALLVTRI